MNIITNREINDSRKGLKKFGYKPNEKGINENDYALTWLRRKPSDEQRARLGHYLKKLYSETAYYLDLTDSPGVGDEHSYFKLQVSDPDNLKKMFVDIFQGGCAEKLMNYDDSLNVYRLK